MILSNWDNDPVKEKQAKKFIGGSILIGLAIVVVAVLTYMCVWEINPGYAGVIYDMDGGVESDVLSQGYKITAPWKKVIEYPISTESVYYSKSADEGKKDKDSSINVNTRDGKTVNVDVTYTYHMDVTKLADVFTNFRGQPANILEEGIMKNEMYQAVNEVTSQYSLMDMIGDKRPEVNAKILNKFKLGLADQGIIIETFNLSRIAPDDQTVQAIQNVVNAQNALAQSKIEQQQADVEAQKARIVAQGKADAAVIEANGQAQANDKLQMSLTSLIIQQHQIDKWNGELPKYNLGSGSNTLLNIQ